MLPVMDYPRVSRFPPQDRGIAGSGNEIGSLVEPWLILG